LEYGTAFPAAALALAADEEVVPLADYGPDFVVEAQRANPRVKSFDLRRLTSLVTPSEEFFTFHQNDTVRADAAGYRLHVGGLVKRALELTLSDLLARPDRKSVGAVIECSGNSGNPHIMNGLVSHSVWTGISLAAILREAGVLPEAREVVFLGMDVIDEKKWQAGNASYPTPHGRSIYIQDAMAQDNLLAFAMNGKPLSPEHGFPLRLIMPGWYGMAQVKWLNRIQVIDRRYEGRDMARNYQSLRASGPFWLETSIGKNNLKSVIARVTRQGTKHIIAGAAWGGPAQIEAVEVQVDGGPWEPAQIGQRAGNAGWLLWSKEWEAPPTGRHELVSRARNMLGQLQPTREELRASLVSNREDHSQWVRTVVL
jgi:DMSO/TMAO reductase YedYZ molybdopterin-dependent catalytic subunit